MGKIKNYSKKNRMMGMMFLIFLASSLSFGALPFENAFQKYMNGEYAPKYSQDFLYSRRYVFVSGFTVESVKGDFLDQKETLKKLGVPPSLIHHVKVPSEFLQSELLQIQKKGSEKWMIIAHSKAGLDVLKTLIQGLALFEDQLEAVILLQVPFGGTPIADVVPPKVQTASVFGVSLSFLGSALKKNILPSTVSQGMYQLNTSSTIKNWEEIQEHMDAATLTFFREKVFYVRAWKSAASVSRELKTAAQLVSTYCEKNDGVVCLHAQRLSGVGTDLGILNVDHMELETQSEKTGSAFLRDSFMLALVEVF